MSKPPKSETSGCYKCKASFSLKVPSIECPFCSRRFCRQHVRGSSKSSDLICDYCEKQHLKEKLKEETRPQLESLRKELESLLEEKEIQRQEVKVKTGALTRLEKQLQNSSVQHKDKINSLNKKINQETEAKNRLDSVIMSLKSAWNESSENETFVKNKFQRLEKEKLEEEKELVTMHKTLSQLTITLDGLNSQLRDTVEFTRLKILSCPECYKKLKVELEAQIKEILNHEGRQSLMKSFFKRSSIRPSLQNYDKLENKSCNCLTF